MTTDPGRSLLEESTPADPLLLFADWYRAAESCGMSEPAAMALATATPDGIPSVRLVLLRGFDERGFAFFTNYLSRKADELAVNPRAALVLHWPPLERQVRIEGIVTRVSAAESDAYFRGRPVGHRLAALVAQQSQIVADRAALEKRMEELTRHYEGQEVPRPADWGGYRVTPTMIEFWQGRLNRLHDRLRYVLDNDSAWRRERLAP